ncbi:MAG: cation transporter [Clostridia bacterium]|nr:cation transporter [Clostridia bacterium]
MKKVFKLQDLDCANCAAKMEKAISKIDGVQSVRVNFMTQKMTLEADDARFESIVDEAARQIKKIEPDCMIIR